MKRLQPLRRHTPAASSHDALSITAPRSEPASGSVRSIAQVSPADTRGKKRCLISSDANSLMVSAQSCKPQIFSKPASARATISLAIAKHVTGMLRPSYLRGSVIPPKPAALSASMLRTVPEAYSTWSLTTRGPSWSTLSALAAITSPHTSPTISNTRRYESSASSTSWGA